MPWLVLLALVATLILSGDTAAQQCPALPYYGLCRIDAAMNPGAPCACQAANGAWIRGVCIH